MMKFEHFVLTVAIATTGACASAPIPYQAPARATPPSGRVTVSQAVNLLDSSDSEELHFAEGKATLESLVGVMPDGQYLAGLINFGGMRREASGVADFNRPILSTLAKNASFLKGTTPIFSVLENDLAGSIGGGAGPAAIVLISDGLATDYAGRDGVDEMTIEAARALAASRSGGTCYHTVQVGNSQAGASLLQSLANTTSCGSFRNASSLTSASALQQFSRDVYLAGGPPPAPRVARDSDQDGVSDSLDACPNTLRGARVDARGCWTLKDLRFAVNGAEIESGFTASLREDIAVLKANPGVRMRIDGHTDSDGSADYNLGLSLRRAASVRDFLVNQGGLNPDRFETKGFGETMPIVPNDSSANKRLNRRVELTILE